MKIDLGGDSTVTAAIREGVRDALLDPRFGRELLLELAGRFIYVTLDEAAEIVGHDVRTVRRWATRNKIEWSRAFGDRQKRYRLGSIRDGMQRKSVGARGAAKVAATAAPAPPLNGNGQGHGHGHGPVPFPPAPAAPPVPLRGVRMLIKTAAP